MRRRDEGEDRRGRGREGRDNFAYMTGDYLNGRVIYHLFLFSILRLMGMSGGNLRL
jgi:hypothetical protein